MQKTLTAIMAAAAIAAAITLLSAPAAKVDAGPVAKPVEAAMIECANRPWPYLRCVGTEFGNQRVRLVAAERLAQ
jgi:Spy/CpxP family protein refolding chaperone